MKVTCIGPLIPAINQANDQSPGKKDGCHPPSNGARLSLTLFECPLSICGFVLTAAIWLFNSPLRTAVISVSMTFGRWSKEGTAMAVLLFSNSTVRDGCPRHTFRCQRDATTLERFA
jgi:hypothetical protein